MKRLIGHIVMVLLVIQASAQILAPMGNGLPEAPDKITNYKSGIVVVYDNRFADVELQVWNGDFWYTLERPNLPKVGENDNGNYSIVDLITFNNEVYLATAYDSKIEGVTNNTISKWDGSDWSDVSNSLVNESNSLVKLFIENETLKCIGKFSSGLDRYNIIQLKDGNWTPQGNLITRNLENDAITSIAAKDGKLYATGNFTNPTANNVSLAVWNGSEWSPANNPPFTGKNIALGTYQEKVVVFGKSDFSDQPIVVSFGDNWQGLSTGLENYSVENIAQFAEIGDNLFAVGSFIDNVTNTQSNLMVYDGEKWDKTLLNLSDIEQLYSFDSHVLVSGDFYDNGRLNGIGTIYTDRAQITARVYNDKNGDCTKDENEEWMPNYPIHLEGQNFDFITDLSGQLYLPVKKDKHTINASAYEYYLPTCTDLEVDVDEYKTYYGAALGVKQQTGISDAAITISDDQSYKAQLNEDKVAQICLSDKGSQNLTGATVTLYIGEDISNFTSSIPFDSYIGNTVTWTLNGNQLDNNCFTISYRISGLDDTKLSATVQLNGGLEDFNTTNNSASLQYKKGETLENNKHCANGKIIDPSTEVMSYKIGYKNTGSKPAISVKIVDLLDKDIRIIGGVTYSTTQYPGANITTSGTPTFVGGVYRQKLIITIEDIQIPTSTSDDIASRGFVDMDISMKKVPKGTEICNTAQIHFSSKKGSYDEPILTDTVCSVVGETVGIVNSTILTEGANDLTIGPNPVQDFIQFDNSGYNKYSITVVNALGQTVMNTQIKPFSKSELDVRELESGVYFVYSNGIFAKKFVLY